jgi:hypothetical protein
VIHHHQTLSLASVLKFLSHASLVPLITISIVRWGLLLFCFLLNYNW